MAREYIAAVDPLDKPLIFRTLLLTGCAGNFNALFSGDGFTYTSTAREAVSCVCRSLQAEEMRLQDQTGHCNCKCTSHKQMLHASSRCPSAVLHPCPHAA
jgi:hypothetical protein